MFINSYYKAYINIWKYYWGRALKETGLGINRKNIYSFGC